MVRSANSRSQRKQFYVLQWVLDRIQLFSFILLLVSSVYFHPVLCSSPFKLWEMFGKYVVTQHCPEFKNDDRDDHIWKKNKNKKSFTWRSLSLHSKKKIAMKIQNEQTKNIVYGKDFPLVNQQMYWEICLSVKIDQIIYLHSHHHGWFNFLNEGFFIVFLTGGCSCLFAFLVDFKPDCR